MVQTSKTNCHVAIITTFDICSIGTKQYIVPRTYNYTVNNIDN